MFTHALKVVPPVHNVSDLYWGDGFRYDMRHGVLCWNIHSTKMLCTSQVINTMVDNQTTDKN